MSTTPTGPTFTLDEVPDYYSETYHYRRFPARIKGRNGIDRAGNFCVWSRDVERPNPNHVTWDPETAVLVAREYQTPEWLAEQREKRERTPVSVGDRVRLGDVVVTVPARAREYVSHVPCEVVAS